MSFSRRNSPAGANSADDSADVRVAAAVEAYQAQAQAGRRPDRHAFLAQYPDLAPALGECLDGLDFVNSAANDLSGSSDELVPAGGELVPGVIGDYRIIREVGRGGMGVVYEAEQVSLRRRVALKVLPFAAVMDPRALQRFHNEALAAAALDHPHVVRVHGVGHERGVHFIAMQFVDGRTLADLIRERRTPAMAGAGDTPPLAAGGLPGADSTVTQAGGPAPRAGATGVPPSASRTPVDAAYARRVAEWGAQAADALEHAHQLGIVHRDVKPANILVDSRGNLWVADFGLARVTADPGMTETGALLGTPRYMSPEQASAAHGLVDHRTDVYALGATLYELLTLTPAVGGADRADVLRRIAADDPTPPRKLDQHVPADLETIVLKCLAKDPADRYPTAAVLVKDLRRWLTGEPILARKVGRTARTARWVRRNPRVTAVGVLLAALAAGLAGTSALLWKQRDRAAAAAAAEVTERQRAERAEAAARRQRDEARKAVDAMYTDVAENLLAKLPNAEPVRREFLLKALAYYEQFARDDEADPLARYGAALANYRMGTLYYFLEDLEKAAGPLHRAVFLLERLVADDPESAEYRAALASAFFNRSHVRPGPDGVRANLADRRRAVALYEGLAAEFPGNLGYAKSLVHISNREGLLLQDTQGLEAAEVAHRRGLALAEKAMITFPAERGLRAERAFARIDLGCLALRAGRVDEAAEVLGDGLADWEEVFRQDTSAGVREQLAASALILANLRVQAGRPNDARFGYARAGGLFSRLAAEYPQQMRFSTRAIQCANGLLLITSAAGDREQLSKLAADLTRELPAHPAIRVAAARLLGRHAALTRQDRCWKKGSGWEWTRDTDLFSTAAVLRLIDQNTPPTAAGQNQLAWELSVHPEAWPGWSERAVALARVAVRLDPIQGRYWNTLGAAYYRHGEWAAASNAFLTSIRLDPLTGAYDQFFLAMVYWQLGQRDMARYWYQQGVKNKVWSDFPSNDVPQLRAEAAALLGVK